jgi:hypothetical protein
VGYTTWVAAVVRVTVSCGKLGEDKVRALCTGAEQALQLLGNDPAIALSEHYLSSPRRSPPRLAAAPHTDQCALHEAAWDATLSHMSYVPDDDGGAGSSAIFSSTDTDRREYDFALTKASPTNTTVAI